MAKVSFENKPIGQVSSVQTYQLPRTVIVDSGTKISLIDKSITARSLYPSDKIYTYVSYDRIGATPRSVLPFRVRFTNIGVVGYSPDNPAPLGIAIIGVNNYIL